MSDYDRKKWNDKFRQMSDLLAPRPPSVMVERFYRDVDGKRALDLACGGGRHTLFLSAKGFDVDAVDISDVALKRLAQRVDSKRVRLIEADLDTYVIEKNRYDFIVKTNYLDRNLIECAKTALKSGGIFIVETYMEDEANEKKDSNPDFLLKKGELPALFHKGFDLLVYETFWNEGYEKYRMKKAAIAVRKL